MKRFLVTLLFVTLMLSLCTFTVFAASEGEPNDKKANATSISLGTEVTGNISKSSDQDWFKFTTSRDGYITVDLEHEIISSSSSYWRIYVYQSDGVTSINDYDGYWTVAGNQNGKTSQIGLKAGTYYIKIQYNPYNHSEVSYTLRVNFTETVNTELEPNSSAKKATQIAVNTDYNGAVAGSSDSDWFKFDLTSDGYISVDFLHEMISSSSSYWRIYVYQADGVTSVNNYDGYWTVEGNANGRTSQIGLKAGTYYVKIQYNPYNQSDVTYTLRVNFTESSLTEYEPNSDIKKATVIDVNKDYMGAIAGSSDADWYQFTVPADGYITIKFDHELISSSSSYWRLYVYLADGVTGINDYDGYWAIEGNKNGKTSQIGLHAGTYCIKVQYNPYNHSDVTYKLRVDYTETEYTEFEPNSSSTKATEIKPNTDYLGAIAGSSDADWYKFTLSSKAQITLNFYHEMLESSSKYWNVYLYSSDGVTELFKNSVAGNNNGAFDVGELGAGSYYVKITYCPYNESDVTYKLNVSEKHDCVGKWIMSKEPTCTEEGQREEVCSICGKSIQTEIITAYGHVSENWTVVKEPTCTETGYRYANCDRCHEDVQEVTEILPHAYGEWQIVSGNKVIPPIVREQKCEQCGYVNSVKDWSYIWITILVGLAVVGVGIGVINYVKAFKSKN